MMEEKIKALINELIRKTEIKEIEWNKVGETDQFNINFNNGNISIDKTITKTIKRSIYYRLRISNKENEVIYSNRVSKDMAESEYDLLKDLHDKVKRSYLKVDEILDNLFEEIKQSKETILNIPIDNQWKLNHWGSTFASIVGDKMIFEGNIEMLEGESMNKGEDGSHININDKLEIGKTYEISCFAKSSLLASGEFRLWCHDRTGIEPSKVNVTTEFKKPSFEGEIIKINFKPENNKNIRIHLQYKPGEGKIEVSNVKIAELKLL